MGGTAHWLCYNDKVVLEVQISESFESFIRRKGNLKILNKRRLLNSERNKPEIWLEIIRLMVTIWGWDSVYGVMYW